MSRLEFVGIDEDDIELIGLKSTKKYEHTCFMCKEKAKSKTFYTQHPIDWSRDQIL